MTMSVFCFFMSIGLVFIPPVRAQDIQIANSSPFYPVTTGDVYSLSYAGNTHTIIVDYTYRIRIPNLGVISGAGKTYQQLKREIEAIITNNYPQSEVQFSLASPSSFRVYINGEVRNAGERTTWAMGRLSSLLSGLSMYSSLRTITVTSADGQSKSYDLFKAQRSGDLSQDPYLRPEDVITIHRIDRVVSISGEVERPESYELLPGENLQDLITNYANGFTLMADINRIELTRYAGGGWNSSDKISLTQEDIDADYLLQHLDAVYVPSR
jgi:protein involved in polysaccharide export with SLBB domain